MTCTQSIPYTCKKSPHFIKKCGDFLLRFLTIKLVLQQKLWIIASSCERLETIEKAVVCVSQTTLSYPKL